MCLFYPLFMGISTVSFDKIRIYKNKIVFTNFGKNCVYSKVFDNCGNNVINRISYKPIKTFDENKIVMMRKNQYETPVKGYIFETIKRIYNNFGKLTDIKKEFYEA